MHSVPWEALAEAAKPRTASMPIAAAAKALFATISDARRNKVIRNKEGGCFLSSICTSLRSFETLLRQIEVPVTEDYVTLAAESWRKSQKLQGSPSVECCAGVQKLNDAFFSSTTQRPLNFYRFMRIPSLGKFLMARRSLAMINE